MKNIKIVMLLICLALSAKQYGQTEVRDLKLNGYRGTQVAFLATIVAERKLMQDELKKLEDIEEAYQDKLDPGANITSAAVYLGLEYLTQQTDQLIQDLETQVANIEAIPFFLRHGIKDIKSALAKEKAYFDRANGDIVQSTIDAAVAGGVGYNYTYWLKKYLQIRKIKSSLQAIQYDLDNRSAINRIFKQ